MSEIDKKIAHINKLQEEILGNYLNNMQDGSIKIRIAPYLNVKTMRDPKMLSFVEHNAEQYKAWLPKNTQETLGKFKELESSRQTALNGKETEITNRSPQTAKSGSATLQTPSLLDQASTVASNFANTVKGYTLSGVHSIHTWWKENNAVPAEKTYGSTVSVGTTSNLGKTHFSQSANPESTKNQGINTYAGYSIFNSLSEQNNTNAQKENIPPESATAALIRYGALPP